MNIFHPFMALISLYIISCLSIKYYYYLKPLKKNKIRSKKLSKNDRLLIAVVTNQMNSIKELVKEGCDINYRTKKNKPLLHIAIENEYDMIVSELLYQKSIDVNALDSKNQTALMKAVLNKDLELVNILIDMGCDIDIKDNSYNTALIYAAMVQDIDTVHRLLEAECDSTIKNKYDKTYINYLNQDQLIMLNMINSSTNNVYWSNFKEKLKDVI